MNLTAEKEFTAFDVKINIRPFEGSCLTFSNGNWECDCDSYYDSLKYIEINVTGENDEPVALIILYVVPSDDAYYYPEDTIALADAFEQDAYDEFETLLSGLFFRKCYDEYMECMMDEDVKSYSGSIQNFYIYPEYRKVGLGVFLMNNINAIIYKFLGFKLLCLTTILNPFADDNSSERHYAKSKDVMSDSEIKMLKDMRKFMRKVGFKKVRGKQDWFIGCVYKG